MQAGGRGVQAARSGGLMIHKAESGLLPLFLKQFPLVLAVCVGSGLAHMGTSTMPFQVGALIEGTGRAASEAGLFGFFQVGALAIGMIAISAWVDRVHPRLIAIGSALLSAAASVGLFLAHGFALELVFGTLMGL